MESFAAVLIPIAIFGSFGLTLYYFTKVLTDYVLKKKMIEKGFINEESQSIFKDFRSENKYSPLKWGLLIMSAGIALIIIDVLNVEPDTPLPYGIFAVVLSCGFLGYYMIIKKK
jgi:hypothetical protein